VVACVDDLGELAAPPAEGAEDHVEVADQPGQQHAAGRQGVRHGGGGIGQPAQLAQGPAKLALAAVQRDLGLVQQDRDVGLRVGIEDAGELVDGDEAGGVLGRDRGAVRQRPGAGRAGIDVDKQVLEGAGRAQLRRRVGEDLAPDARVEAERDEGAAVRIADVRDLAEGGPRHGRGRAVGGVEALGVSEDDRHHVLGRRHERQADRLLAHRVAGEDQRRDDLDDDGEPTQRDPPGGARGVDEAPEKAGEVDRCSQDAHGWQRPIACI